MIERFDAPGLARTPGHSHAVAASAGRLVPNAGAVPLDEDGNLVGPGEHVAQARRVLGTLGLALEAAGTGWEDVLKTTVYVVRGEGKT